jgi:predicted RNase H-like HicB family nuclease
MNTYRFSVYVTRGVEGWAACSPEFPNCRAQGATYEDAVSNLRDLVQIMVEDGLGDDETPPRLEELSLTNLDLAL